MKTITVFIASSSELENDRNSIHALIASLDDIFEPRGIRIKCRKWEDFLSYCTGERTQTAYNEIVRASDICVCMFHKLAGKFTIEEFRQALDEYEKTKKNPKTYVYVRTLVEGEVETQELKSFKDELFNTIGHYWCNYSNNDTMKLNFVMQLERLLPDIGNDLDKETQITVNDGKVSLQGIIVANYNNLSFATANIEYQSLKEKCALLYKDITDLRNVGIEETVPILSNKVSEYVKCKEQIATLESQLLDMALLINKTISSNSPISERKRLAIELFEQGNIKGVVNVLNEDEIALDTKIAENKIAHGRELEKVSRNLIEEGIKTICSHVEEYIMRAKALMMDFENEDRFELACKAYECAISIAKKNLKQKWIINVLIIYGIFLLKNNQYSKAKNIWFDLLTAYQNLSEDSEEKEIYIARVKTYIAIIYDRMHVFSESEKYFKEAIATYRYFSLKNSKNKIGLAFVLIKIGDMLRHSNRYEECESVLNEALSIYKNMPQVDNGLYAYCLMNLANLYNDIYKEAEAEKLYKEAIDIYENLATVKPKVYDADIALTKMNLGLLYIKDDRKKVEGEQLLKASLYVFEDITNKYPQAFGQSLIDNLRYLAMLYADNDSFIEKSKIHNASLDICKLLAKTAPDIYNKDIEYIQKTLQNIALCLSIRATKANEDGDIVKSLKDFEEALRIYQNLAKDEPNRFDFKLAGVQKELACLYFNTQQYSKSDDMYDAAIEKYKLLEKTDEGKYLKDIAYCLYYKANSKIHQEKETEAIAVLEEVVPLYKKIYENGLFYSSYVEALNLLISLYDDKESIETVIGQNISQVLEFHKNDSEFSKESISKFLMNASLYYMFTKEYVGVEKIIKEILPNADSTYHWIFLIQIEVLLLQGRYSEAETIYKEYLSEYKEYQSEINDALFAFFDECEEYLEISQELKKEIEHIKNL